MNKLNIIEDISRGSGNRLREKFIKKNYNDVYNLIIKYSKNLDIPFKQKIWHWVNEEPNYINCYCGNRVSFNMKWKDGYKEYCSNKCSSNSNKVKSKLKKTLNERYGVEHYSKTKEFKQKYKRTNNERYGVDNYSKTVEYLEKSKDTYLRLYGVDNYTKTKEYLKKSKDTYMARYGVDNYTKTKDFKVKYRKKIKEKYKTDSIHKNELFRKKNHNISKDKNYIKYLGNNESLFKCDCGEEHEFVLKTDNYYGRIYNNNKLCTICYPINKLSSIKEKELLNFINDNYNGGIISNYRDTLEIDIYLPELNIGIEFNGLYYHSNKFKENDYHINKTKYFEDKGIRILHIWEDEWIHKKDIVKSQILNHLNKSERIFARKCEVIELNKEHLEFLDNNHLQGRVGSILKLGLMNNGKLVSVMTFDKFEGRKKMNENEWNLNRFCNLKNTTVIGGASKLFKYFVRTYKPKRVISYADRDWSIGGLYNNLGFVKLYNSKPDYKYILNGKRIHKSNFRKSLNRDNMSEREYTESIYLNKVYDCGKIKYEIKNPL